MQTSATALLESNNFPEALLDLLVKQHIRLEENQKEKLVEKLTEQYQQTTKPETKQLIIDAICANLPKSSVFLHSLQKKCEAMIQAQQNLGYAIPLLKQILNYLPIEVSSVFLETILKTEGVDVVPLLGLISRVLRTYKGSITQAEFEKILQLTKPLFQTASDVVTKFYLETLHSSVFTSEMQLELFDNVCNTGHLDISFLKVLFMRINSSNITYDNFHGISCIKSLAACQRLDRLWTLLVNDGLEGVDELLVTIYAHAKDPDASFQFIEKCMAQIHHAGVLAALARFVHAVEDGINKDLLGIQINRFLTDSDMITLNLTGAVTMRLRIPNDLSTESIMSQIAQAIGQPRHSLVLKEGDRILSVDDQVVDEMTLDVLIGASVEPDEQVVVDTLPSTILSGPDIAHQHMELLVSDDSNLSMRALSVLELIPTVKEELDNMWNLTTDWSSSLSTKHPYLLVYRLNIIGNLFRSHSQKWMDHFVASGLDAFFQRLFEADESCV